MTVLARNRSGYWPPTFEQDALGNTYIANGIDQTLRIRRYANQVTLAGIEAPLTAPVLASSGTGTLTGTYTAYVRYIDQDGIPSNLSPISNEITVTNVGQFDYSSIPIPPAPPSGFAQRETGREIYRNTTGQSTVYYKVGTINDITTTTFSESYTDEQMFELTALPILNFDGSLNANRFTPPPDHKAVIVQHNDRMWYAVDVPYSQGNVKVTDGSTTIQGLGTEWKETFVDRVIHFPRAGEEFTITAVDETNQTITLDSAAVGTGVVGYYTILPVHDERNKLYFSYAGEPESVPAINSFKIQELGADELVGLMPLGQFLFALFRRHIYRISFGISPNDDLAVHKTVSRGAVNHRCWVRVEDVAYLMDREGVHRFEGGHDGGHTEHISEPIQNFFRDGDINWHAERFFFASHNPQEEVVRFHVCLGGNYLPKAALCYQYRHQTWWVEKYPYGFGGTCLAYVVAKGA